MEMWEGCPFLLSGVALKDPSQPRETRRGGGDSLGARGLYSPTVC